jgi:hypothetical protein
MSDSSSNERLFLGKLALLLFVAGLLMPFLIAAVILGSSRDAMFLRGPVAAQLALGFGLVAEILALVLGFLGRRCISGQMGMVGAITVFVLIFVMVGGVALTW